MPPEYSEHAHWFVEHVHPHESLLRAWLKRGFPLCPDVDDIVQESYLRIIRARKDKALVSPKAYLFTTVRNLAIDSLRSMKASRFEPLADSSVESVMDNAASPPEAAAHDQLYDPKQTNTGTIVAKNRDQTPFVTSVLTEDMIDDMRIDNPAELSEVVAGVSQDNNPYLEEGNASGLSYRVRGFVSEPLYNGFQTGGMSHNPDSLGRVEVSKAPNAVLYGQSPAGGVINFVPKAPSFEDHAMVMLGVGSNSSTRTTMVRALLRYAFQTGDLAHRFNLNIENLAEEEFTNEGNFLSEPRIYKLSYALNW